ncbi:hypothetical protein GALMADRAFT_1036536 [Galerina marginata CBS 339.88]|uniref:PARP catalytic domain-containing protein n=1 Tax=Galerina marginata (strain CBS 339.88) TaxID=685588 RepID=A0A067SCH2_GALM3|nr:hypothetical protein GALMADRAFT_1036536 [Galerina marginata CBS 339.88]
MVSLVKNVVHWGSSSRSKTPAPAQVDLCEICGKKPKFVENGHKHPYCSRSCARSGTGPSPTACMLHGCRATGKPAFANFCSEAHAREGVRIGQVEGCELCETQPRMVGTMCIPCDRLVRAEPRLRELSSDGKLFKNLRAQFLSEWESPTTHPTFEKVYEIILPRDARIRHDQYRSSNPTFEEVRSFHSSQCICDLGSKEPVLCNFKSCSICCIVKSSFNSFAFGASSNNGRFGEGVYSYRNPALADRFATSCTSSPYRVMIACDVAVEPTQAEAEESAEEESLFVPLADGILPAYVFMYTTSK